MATTHYFTLRGVRSEDIEARRLARQAALSLEEVDQEEKRLARLHGRSRHLNEDADVMDFNAWDDVEWSEEQLEAAKAKIERQRLIEDEDTRQRYFNRASNYWHDFYAKNKERFFKDRSYLQVEFPALSKFVQSGEPCNVLECGCGVGNTIFPVMEAGANIFVYAFDFAPSAIELVHANPLYQTGRCCAVVWDFASEPIPPAFPLGAMDVVTMIYVLSALRPEDQPKAVAKIFELMKPGATVCFRDYGLYDLTQLRFKDGHKLDDRLYCRGDGTLVYYTTKEELGALFEGAGFIVDSIAYDKRLLVNRKLQITMFRVWIQAFFTKPAL